MGNQPRSLSETLAVVNKAFEPLRSIQKAAVALSIQPSSTLGDDAGRLLDFAETPEAKVRRLEYKIEQLQQGHNAEIEKLEQQHKTIINSKNREIRKQKKLRLNDGTERESVMCQNEFLKDRNKTLQKELEHERLKST